MKIILLSILIFSIALSGCIQTQDTTEFDTQMQLLQTRNVNLHEENTQLQESFDKEKKSTINFFKEYSISLVNIHIATEGLSLASTNLTFGTDYDREEGYYYDIALDYYDTVQSQVEEAQSLLSRAKRKLQVIENSTPNPFFKTEVENRIKQIDILTETSDALFLLAKYMKDELYEINYGSEEKATEALDNYNELILIYNSDLEKIGEIGTEIELEWGQEWYPDYK